ncbi:MAG: M60 family metallopeptidase [Muribaculaceae bacterium]|nr:M60 family metallopeptidase [Muribaculaceae bacterium]
MKLKGILTTLMIVLATGVVWAAGVESGKVYRIVNMAYPNQAISINSSGASAHGATYDANNTSQQWYLTANEGKTGFYMRSAASGGYLKSPKADYNAWPVVSTKIPDDASMLMSVEAVNDYYIIRPVSLKSASLDSHSFAHMQGDYDVVCWAGNSGTTASHWRFEEVPMSKEDIDAMLKRLDSQSDILGSETSIQEHLNALFEDKACTKLNSLSDADFSTHFNALPAALQTMVNKVKTGKWDETNPKATVKDWDSEHALKYRVQLYEPFSNGAGGAGLAHVQPYTNMNNPTGILADAGDFVYVMVNDEIPEGTTLYLGSVTGSEMNNATTPGVKLHQGLNIVLCYGDNSHFFVYYVVNTVSDGKPVRKVTDYKPMKIHIEGGRLNGFFSIAEDELYKADTWDDYKYTVARATHTMYDLIGKYVIIHFHLNDTPKKPDTPNEIGWGVRSVLDQTKNPNKYKYNPVEIVQDWDKMCLSERILMGIQSDEDIALPFNRGLYSTIVNEGYSYTTPGGKTYLADPGFHYSDYFNNRMLAISMQGDLYMNATYYRTAYNVQQIGYVLTEFHDDGLWGPAHEYGHMNQEVINIAGATEFSNNIFSNVATYYSDDYHGSRNDLQKGHLSTFYEGLPYIRHDGGNTMLALWQLWCYYHGTKHNTKFYPRLFELLRRYPIKKTVGKDKFHYVKDDLLHLAKMCCIAAGEDLTNFFESWCFFKPMDNVYVGDYDDYNMVLTEEDIKEWKEEVASFDFPVNNAIISIDDRVGRGAQYGDVGGFSDFEGDGKVPTGDFSYSVDGTTVNITPGEVDGVGYVIFDEEGNLLGFSNSHSFTVSKEVADALMNGEAHLYVVGSDKDQTTVDVLNPVLDGTPAVKRDMLADLAKKCEDLFANQTDPAGKRVGFFTAEAVEALKTKTAEVKAIIDRVENDGKLLTDTYKEYDSMYRDLLDSEDGRIKIEPGASYLLSNYSYERILDTNFARATAPVVSNKFDEPASFQQLWIFTPAAADREFYISNALTAQYINKPARSSNVPVGSNEQSFTLISYRNGIEKVGVFSFAADNKTSDGIHVDGGGNVVGWDTTSNPTQWYITKVADADSTETGVAAEYKKMLAGIVDNYDAMLANIDETGNRVGFLRPDAADDIEHLRGEVQDLIDSTSSSSAQLREEYSHQTTVYTATANRTDLVIGIEDGASYRIYNRWFSSSLMTADDTHLIPGANSDTGDQAWVNQWILEAQSGNNAYKLRNYEKDKYIGTADSNVPLTDNGQNYTIAPVPGLVGVFYLYPEGKENKTIHLSGNTVIIPYITNAEASKWYITRVHSKDYIKLREDLLGRIDDSESLVNGAGKITPYPATEVTYPKGLTNDPEGLIYSNAIFKGGWPDGFVNWDCILDHNPDTYFHSTYSNNSEDNLNHYIRFRAPGDMTFRYVTFTYWTTSKVGDGARNIQSYRIEVSPDKVSWNTVYTKTGLKVSTPPEEFTTDELLVPVGTKYIRFMVDKSGGSVSNHPFFGIGDAQIMNRTGEVNVTLNSIYQGWIKPEQLKELYYLTEEAKAAQASPSTTQEELQDYYDRLNKAYNDLFRATGVEDVSVDNDLLDGESIFYNLQGVRVVNPEHGIFIRRVGDTVTKVYIP